LPCFVIGAHDAGKAVAVGNAYGGKTKKIGGGDHLFGMRRPAQEGEIGGDRELCIFDGSVLMQCEASSPFREAACSAGGGSAHRLNIPVRRLCGNLPRNV